jgi:hypothetical protein
MYRPSFAEFQELAQKGNLVPVYREILADEETPVTALMEISRDLERSVLEKLTGSFLHPATHSYPFSHDRGLIKKEANFIRIDVHAVGDLNAHQLPERTVAGIQVDEALVHPHLPMIDGLRALSIRRFPAGNAQAFGREWHRSF